jgi:hypothetical protein
MNTALRSMLREDWGWINKKLPILWVEDTCGLVCADEETGIPIAACVMDNWTDNSVQCHLLILRKAAIRGGFLHYCFDFIFNHKDKKYIYGLVPGDNTAALRLNKHLGFTEKCRMENAFKDGVDYVIMELKREACKHLIVQEAA